ncbi:MAG: hypothetical protein ACYS6I_03115 [Planctomycetota bacterium]|jgi:hypothetical protein
MSNDKQISEFSSKLDELQSLLERQIELARQGSIIEVEALSEQATSLAGRLAQSGILESGKFRNRRERLQKLYEDLRLAITVQKVDAFAELRRVRKGRKAVEAYRNNI